MKFIRYLIIHVLPWSVSPLIYNTFKITIKRSFKTSLPICNQFSWVYTNHTSALKFYSIEVVVGDAMKHRRE